MRWASRPNLATGACSISARRRQKDRDLSSRSTAGANRLPIRQAGRAGLKGLIALDGNWAQAKALWWRNAWLTKLRRFVVVPDGPSLYGDLRREARPDAVSTLEAVALSLQVLESDAAVREKLLVPFRALLAKARREGVRDSKRDRRVRR